MRVAYLSQAAHISGAERSLQTLLINLRHLGVHPLLICPHGDQLIPWCQHHGIDWEVCDLAGRDKWHPVRWTLAVRRLSTKLLRHRIDLLHANQLYSYPVGGAAAGKLGIPRICHIRNEVKGGLCWWLSAGVEGLLSISRYIEGQLAEAWPRTHRRPRIQTVVNPVNLPKLGTQAEQDEARVKLRIPRDAFVFGFLGQLIPLKGLRELFEALHGLPGSIPWRLLIAGRDPRPGAVHEVECQRIVARHGWDSRVTFLGYRDNVTPVYQAIDVAVVPSLEEPLGRVPLEAAAHARASIAFAAGGLPETIRHGETGWLVPVGNVEKLRQALQAAMSAPLAKMGADARLWAETTSNPHQYAQQIIEIYRRLLADRQLGSDCLARTGNG